MKRIVKLFLSIVGIASIAVSPVASIFAMAEEGDTENVAFGKNNYYVVEEVFEEMPKTFEAWLQLDTSYKNAGGTIFGNIDANVHVAGSYKSLSTNAISVEIDTKGRPKLYHKDDNGSLATAVFSKVDVRDDDFVHLAITRDEDTAYCYLNGELMDKAEFKTEDFLSAYRFAVGNDFRERRDNYFKGQIKSLAVYSDERTGAEILADKTAVDTDDENLMVAYDLAGKNGAEVIEDISANDNDLTREWLFADEIVEDDYDYSMMVLGDTQALLYFRQCQDSTEPDSFNKLYDYIVNNAEAQKVVHVAQLGDITQKAGSDADASDEWEFVASNYAKMDALYAETGIGYSIAAGNHDYQGGGITGYYDIFGGNESGYAQQYFASSDPTKALTTAHKFSAGGLDYLLVAIGWRATAADIAWADDIIAAHPYHNVIVTTHGYRNVQGNPTGLTSYIEEGDYNWVEGIDEIVKKHKNVVLTLNGHHPTTAIENFVTYGDNGNKITSLVIDPTYFDGEHISATVPNFSQGAGMIAYLRFSDGGKKVGLSWYSAINEQYYNSESVYSIELPVVKQQELSVNVKGTGGSAVASSTTLSSEPVTVNFTPDAHHQLTKVTLNGVDVTANVVNNTYMVTETEGYAVLLAEFAPMSCYLTTQNDGQKGEISYLTQEFPTLAGGTIEFKITPRSGWKVASVDFNGQTVAAGENGVYTIITQDITDMLAVTYEKVVVDSIIIEEVVEGDKPNNDKVEQDGNTDSGSSDGNNQSLGVGCVGSLVNGVSAAVMLLGTAVLTLKKR